MKYKTIENKRLSLEREVQKSCTEVVLRVCRAGLKNVAGYYQYREHLQSSVIECNEHGQVISYEEYYPYGRSAYRAAASGVDLSLKRYRFTGKERDEEIGLDYFGVRYYASWLGRWTSGDPGGFVDGLNLYRYVRNNPVNGIDREGYSTEEVEKEKPKPPPVDKQTIGEAIRDENGDIVTDSQGNPIISSGTDSSVINADPIEKPSNWNRFWGVLQLVGSVAEVVTGAIIAGGGGPAGIIGGTAMALHGIDGVLSALEQIKTGLSVRTKTSEIIQSGLESAGVDPATAENTAIITDAVGGAGTGLIKTPGAVARASRAGAATNATSKVASASSKVDDAVNVMSHSSSLITVANKSVAVHKWKTGVAIGGDPATLINMEELIKHPAKGYFDVLVHGTQMTAVPSKGMKGFPRGIPMPVEEVYKVMLANGYPPGTKIRLIACWSGNYNWAGSGGFAETLMNLAKADVIAPNKLVKMGVDGGIDIGEEIAPGKYIFNEASSILGVDGSHYFNIFKYKGN